MRGGYLKAPAGGGVLKASFSCDRRQTPPDDEQVRQRCGHLQPVQILRKSPVAHLLKAEDALITPITCSTLARTCDFVRFFAFWISSTRQRLTTKLTGSRSGDSPQGERRPVQRMVG